MHDHKRKCVSHDLFVHQVKRKNVFKSLSAAVVHIHEPSSICILPTPERGLESLSFSFLWRKIKQLMGKCRNRMVCFPFGQVLSNERLNP